MADDTTAAGQAIALMEQGRPLREVRVVHSPVAVYDTGKFEHFSRIASLMADTGMMPETLRTEPKKVNGETVLVDLPALTVKARAFMIAELADRIDVSPFALMPCCSFVRGRLMLEGKVAAAVIEAKVGEISFDFGTWDAKTESCDLSKGEGIGDMLAVRVSVVDANGIVKSVDGSVGIWKTSGAGSPWRPGAMKRQLRYRGSRDWERAHKPGLLLGVLSDNESIEDMIEAEDRSRKLNLIDRMAPPAEGERAEGFSQAHVEGETAHVDAPKAKGRAGKAKAAEHEDKTAAQGAAKAAADAIGDDDLPEGLRGASKQADQGDQSLGAQGDPGGSNAAGELDLGEPIDPLTRFVDDALPKIGTWKETKAALRSVMQMDAWDEAGAERQNEVRAKVWDHAAELTRTGADRVDPALDLTAFVCWCERAPELDQVEGTLRTLKNTAIWDDLERDTTSKGKATQAKINSAAERAVARISAQ